MNKRCTNALPLLLLGTLMAASPLLSPMVLCVGDDGHVAIEKKLAGLLNECGVGHRHDHESKEHTPAQQSHSDTNDHCGSCDDFAITQDNWHQSCNPSDILSELLQLAVMAPAVDFNRVATEGKNGELFLSRAPPDTNQVMTALKTIVILS